MNTQYIPTQALDNLFSANHRNAMIERYGYTDAMTMTVDDAISESTTRAELLEDHDCHLSEMDGCTGCEAIFNLQHQ